MHEAVRAPRVPVSTPQKFTKMVHQYPEFKIPVSLCPHVKISGIGNTIWKGFVSTILIKEALGDEFGFLRDSQARHSEQCFVNVTPHFGQVT